ncbi:MAG: HD domain-containing protein [Verrucomicrobia subdivision 3 bacterium]|nr:HD domain-containing protein [Limisphaerales bacterium]
MQPQIDTRIPSEVEKHVYSIYVRMYPDGARAFVPRAFEWVGNCFSGQYGDYQPIDARYHDFEHTLQGTLCLARLLNGRHAAKAKPEIPRKMFELCLLAILFHDTGYLKKRTDSGGTGAKYTPIHVNRSVVFAREFLAPQGYSEAELQIVQNMIRCTGVNVDLRSIPFQSEIEQTLGFALGTGDLLGQMAARDYVDKLPVLYLEFAEAARYDEQGARLNRYTDAEDLMRKTPAFWSNYVWPRINDDFGRLYKFLNEPYPDGPNPYLAAIQRNLDRLQEKLKKK